jgi:hypothetical protein
MAQVGMWLGIAQVILSVLALVGVLVYFVVILLIVSN